MVQTAIADPTYVLGRSENEARRLMLQAQIYDRITRRFLSDAGLAAGMTVLDVGSGGEDVFCTSSAGAFGVCDTTTGNAAYCAVDAGCFPCAKDADCQQICGPAAACIVCAGKECFGTGGTACVAPGDGECAFPPT
jgi:hypothetical protein